METYKVSIHSGVREMETRILQKREPAGDEVLLRVTSCAICTLEQRIWKGVIARYPYAGGHEAAGIVEAVGPDVKGVKPGDKAAVRLLNSCGECYYCRSGHENLCVESFVAHTHSGVMGAGGFAEYMTVSAKAVYKLADDVDLDHAALAEPLACCVHSIRNAKIQLGDDVVVIGAGIMGALHIRLAKMSGARVIVSELDPVRMDVARKMGADIVINASEADPIVQVKELTEGRGADAVFCTVATSAVAKQAVDMAGKLGRVVMYTSFFPDLPIEISPTKLHSGEQILTGSVNPNPVDFLTATRLLSRKLDRRFLSDLRPGPHGRDRPRFPGGRGAQHLPYYRKALKKGLKKAGGHVKWRYQKRMVSAMNLHPLTPEQKNEYTRIAYYYYEAGQTQDQIAQRLGISRQRVNRILAECIERGIVRITVDRSPEEYFASESALEDKYRLKAVRLAHSLGADQLYGNLGVVAGQYLKVHRQAGRYHRLRSRPRRGRAGG